ncbi:hypothetical protein BDY17DRAFT_346604 [Neohortaea acidophila]|uniref:Apple domain-containing protein n=1 Tax=Neohortaea acidophila TaxID=245834 RepID=A0A6A6PRY7_9PEZI|nr:uncharacterized protein BDY17DRAFT_346604 [Neohortaea acidophila]KAF2482536.1 hypothetical protein BDY17DRAFT_346604 [Neohortaea acidophila]
MLSLSQLLCALLALTLCALAAPEHEAPWPATRCYTTIESTTGGLHYTRWGTAWSSTTVRTKTVTKTSTPPGSVTTITSTVTSTHTAPTSTKTATTTTTSTSTTTSIVTTETSTTTTVTTTVPSPFTPVQESIPGASYDASAPLRKRDVEFNHKGSSPKKHSPRNKGFPGPVQCWHYHCSSTTVTVTSTTILPTPTSTTTTTTTSVVTTTPGAVTTVTSSVIITNTHTSTSTTTSTVTNTVTSSTNVSPAQACATNNFANYYNTNYAFFGFNPGPNNDFFVSATATSVAECCMAAVMNPVGQYWDYASGDSCAIETGNNCDAGQMTDTGTGDLGEEGEPPSVVLGNALCGLINSVSVSD